MASLFSPDSKFMLAMSRICDLILLNVLFLLTCVPIFTIGAASTALYTVCFRMDTDREAGLFRGYFSAFRQNFRQSTGLFLILTLILLATAFNVALFSMQTSFLHYLSYLFILLAVLAVLIYSYIFPLLSQFDNGMVATFRNALLLSIGYLPRSILTALLNVFPLALLVMNLYTFLHMGFLWAFFYFAAAAYLNSRLLKQVFAPYWNTKEETK